MKNLCSKQTEICFLVYYATFFNTKTVYSNQAGTSQLFNFLSYFSNTKNVRSKQIGDSFLIHSATFVIPKMYGQNKQGDCLSYFSNTKSVYSKQFY